MCVISSRTFLFNVLLTITQIKYRHRASTGKDCCETVDKEPCVVPACPHWKQWAEWSSCSQLKIINELFVCFIHNSRCLSISRQSPAPHLDRPRKRARVFRHEPVLELTVMAPQLIAALPSRTSSANVKILTP